MISKAFGLLSPRLSPFDSRTRAGDPNRQDSVRQDSVSSSHHPLDYSKLRQDLVRAVARICPGWLSNQREDLVQIAVMRVMHSISMRAPAVEGDSPLTSSYLYRVAYSALIDEIRRVRRRRETNLEDEAVGSSAVTDESPEKVMASRDIGRGIIDCLGRMKRERRLAVTLYLQGHSIPDASRLLDWPAKRTENLVYRGLADLRGCLMSKGIRP